VERVADAVKPTQRYAVIRALEDFFLPLTRSEANMILNAARAGYFVATNWESYNEENKRSHIRSTLAGVADEALVGLAGFLPEDKQISLAIQSPSDSPHTAEAEYVSDGPIFVVHGHSHAVLHEAVRVLERGTGREVIVLHEQANAGRTILEKFEDHAAHVSFAVVLLTGDDEGGVRTSDSRHLRGRQNVIFELGFFFGKLGRRRVAVLLEGSVEKPSDIDGLVYIDLDRAGAWKQALARELEAADIPVDRSRMP
jgi:predicted nucleotide-binding protein